MAAFGGAITVVTAAESGCCERTHGDVMGLVSCAGRLCGCEATKCWMLVLEFTTHCGLDCHCAFTVSACCELAFEWRL